MRRLIAMSPALFQRSRAKINYYGVDPRDGLTPRPRYTGIVPPPGARGRLTLLDALQPIENDVAFNMVMDLCHPHTVLLLESLDDVFDHVFSPQAVAQSLNAYTQGGAGMIQHHYVRGQTTASDSVNTRRAIQDWTPGSLVAPPTLLLGGHAARAKAEACAAAEARAATLQGRIEEAEARQHNRQQAVRDATRAKQQVNQRVAAAARAEDQIERQLIEASTHEPLEEQDVRDAAARTAAASAKASALQDKCAAAEADVVAKQADEHAMQAKLDASVPPNLRNGEDPVFRVASLRSALASKKRAKQKLEQAAQLARKAQDKQSAAVSQLEAAARTASEALEDAPPQPERAGTVADLSTLAESMRARLAKRQGMPEEARGLTLAQLEAQLRALKVSALGSAIARQQRSAAAARAACC